VELASRYPVRIVQLSHPEERCCGIGPQLGFQHARGEYIYILDGDMRLAQGFLEKALTFLAQHPEVAGVGGRVVEMNTDSLEFRERVARGAPHFKPGEVDRLDMGGLYRRRAIEQAGYISDRNLHSYEEFDLAVRLRSLGWKLWRLPVDAVAHFGHDAPPYALLVRRWRTKYVRGSGELLRGAWGRPHMKLVLRDLRELRIYMGVLIWWAALLGIAAFWPQPPAQRLAAVIMLAVFPFLVMAARKRSFGRAAHSVVSWCFNAAGMVQGLVHPRTLPRERIASIVLHEPPHSIETARQQHIA
jgi:hypothetical protein